MNRDHAKRALDFLADMIRFKSYSGTPGEGELARFVVEQMQRRAASIPQRRIRSSSPTFPSVMSANPPLRPEVPQPIAFASRTTASRPCVPASR